MLLASRPGYPAIEMMARTCGLQIAHYPLKRERGFRLDPNEILNRVDNATPRVVVNSPHNPTGAVVLHSDLIRLAGQLATLGVSLLVDEVFWPLSDIGVPSAAAIGGTIAVGDLSKVFSLPGLRIGWLVAPKQNYRDRAAERRSWLSVSTAPLLEHLALFALERPDKFIERTRLSVRANLRLLGDMIGSYGGRLDLVRPAGGTTAFPSIVAGNSTHLSRAGSRWRP